jgi:mRNA interferase RelE/StbE
MASYEIEVTATAERQLRRLPEGPRRRIADALGKLAHDPRPRGCRKLRGHDDVFRIRVGSYRVLYAVEEARILVIILKIGHRRSIYG